MKICVLIPSYNGSQTIGPLVKKIKSKRLDVVVVDDGSVDRTGDIAKESGADVLRHGQNEGKGAALKEGFRYLLNKGYNAVITMDGDNQHAPGDIPKFINAVSDSSVDMVVGNRMSSSKGMPLVRWMTNKLMSRLISLICRRNIPDSQCGFRLIKKKALEEVRPTSNNYEIESEMIIQACRQRFKIKFVPVQTIYAKQTSQINPVVDTVRSLRLALKVFCPFLFNK